MILNTITLTPEIKDQAMQMAEVVFEASSHPDQIRPNDETFTKLVALSPDSILYEVTEDNRLAGWVVSIPTTKELMHKFLEDEVTEQGLLDQSKPLDQYPALYLCAAATLPEFRRRGVSLKLAKEAISRMSLTEDYEMYAWPTTKEGNLVLKKLEEETGNVIHIKK